MLKAKKRFYSWNDYLKDKEETNTLTKHRTVHELTEEEENYDYQSVLDERAALRGNPDDGEGSRLMERYKKELELKKKRSVIV
jgi:hypothetical protein